VLIGAKAIIFAPPIAIIASIYINKKWIDDKLKVKDGSDEDDSDGGTTNTNTNKNESNTAVTINIDNSVNHDKSESEFVGDPTMKVKPEELKDVNIANLDIVSILELYGYISANQRFKMISSSLFESSDQMVNKLLEMSALTEDELKEATAILNLIKLNKRIITKEEALKYIIKYNQKKATSEEEGGNNAGDSQ
jgi:hypothetical protein